MWEYSDKVKDHFFHPRNVGEIPDADAVGEVGAIACGDALKLYLKIDDGERIVDAKFHTFGCGSAIASSSALTEMIKGLTLEEASKITNRDIARYLDGLPQEKMHCSVMGMEALEAAIANYRGVPIEEDREVEGVLVCTCFGVTDEKIRRTIRDNDLSTVEEVTHYCKAGGGCGSCRPEIEDLIREVWSERRAAEQAAQTLRPALAADKGAAAGAGAGRSGGRTNLQRIALIEETIRTLIAPALRADGGDIELFDVAGSVVQVRLTGSCAGCPSAMVTLRQFVQNKLREALGEESLVVEEVES